jgi:hypothetical protein
MMGGMFTRVVMVIIGGAFAISAFAKDLGFGPAFSRRPNTHSATLAGRICIFILGAALVFSGITGITEFWTFSK